LFQQRYKIDKIPSRQGIKMCCKMYDLHYVDTVRSRKTFFYKKIDSSEIQVVRSLIRISVLSPYFLLLLN
jgi:hypothetical protein